MFSFVIGAKSKQNVSGLLSYTGDVMDDDSSEYPGQWISQTGIRVLCGGNVIVAFNGTSIIASLLSNLAPRYIFLLTQNKSMQITPDQGKEPVFLAV